MGKEYLTEELLTVHETAQGLSKTEAAVRNLIKTGSLESVKVKTLRLVLRWAVARYKQKKGL